MGRYYDYTLFFAEKVLLYQDNHAFFEARDTAAHQVDIATVHYGKYTDKEQHSPQPLDAVVDGVAVEKDDGPYRSLMPADNLYIPIIEDLILRNA